MNRFIKAMNLKSRKKRKGRSNLLISKLTKEDEKTTRPSVLAQKR